jgi:hypothetical protein
MGWWALLSVLHFDTIWAFLLLVCLANSGEYFVVIYCVGRDRRSLEDFMKLPRNELLS